MRRTVGKRSLKGARFLTTSILMVGIAPAHANLSNAVFYADFELSTPVNDLVTDTNLNTGTAVGTWSVHDYQESDIRQGGGTTALLADTGAYDYSVNFYAAGVLDDDGVTISLDTYMRRTGDASENEVNFKPQKIVGLDSNGHEVFDIRINAGTTHADASRVGYIDPSGTIQYLGASGDVNVSFSNTPDTNLFQNLAVTLHSTTMDISYDGTTLASGIPYRNAGVTHISEVRLAGVNNKTGAFYDNVVATAETISSLNGWAREGFVPYNTQGDNLIHVTTADFDEVGVKDYVVGMSVEGKVIAFQRPDLISDPSAAANRLWEYQTPCSFNIMITAGEADGAYDGDEILIPGTDGHLRILDSDGNLVKDWDVSDGALYCVDVGRNSSGWIRIVAGGVDGNIYVYNRNGVLQGTVRPASTGVIRRVVVGNFDGIGGDEMITFYDNNSFSGGNYFEVTDLDTMARPSYWGASGLNENDVQQNMGWTDKQLPYAYDMDGDGDDELVGHWGVLHPEDGAGTQVLSTMLATGERLRLAEEYDDVYETTDTGKYLLQQGVPGDFRDWSDFPGPEMVTIYGDDLYLVDYDTVNETTNEWFRVKDYAYAHTLYHFTDGARLESRSGGLDKLVLAGPVNGDDHFYVVNLNGNQWKTDARHIDGNGVLGEVRDSLDVLAADIDTFSGTVADAGDPVWYIEYFASGLGTWDKTDPAVVAEKADGVKAAMDEWSDDVFGIGYSPQRVYPTASLSPASNGTVPVYAATNGLENFATALAERGAHFCLNIGKGDDLYITPEQLADIFEASIYNGHCYMMARTKELSETYYIDTYKPHMDAVIARAATLGVDPPKIMFCTKGSIYSVLTPTQASTYFPAYKEVFVPGVENSNVTEVEWSFAERAGLWLNGDVEDWGCNSIGDNMSANRVVEFGGMRNGHVMLRHLLSQYALGAKFFRLTSIQSEVSPLFERDGEGPEFVSAYRQGVFSFLKIVEAGIYPNSPDVAQVKGVSPVAAALYNPNYTRLKSLTYNHNYKDYAAPVRDYVLNNLSCWNAFTDVPDVDLTAIMHNTTRRWDNLLPTSPSGFVPVIPYSDRSALEANAWCNRAYQTDGDDWSEFSSLATARDSITAEMISQQTNMLIYVDGECFWQVTEDRNDSDTVFVVAMDSGVLSPTDRTVALKKGANAGAWLVYDQFGSQLNPIGQLVSENDEITFNIPAGSVRLFVLQRANTPPVWGNLDYDDATEDSAYVGWTAWRVNDAEDDPLTFAKVSGPDWISVDASNGKLSGTPSQADVGTVNLELSVSDGVNPPVIATITFEVIAINGWTQLLYDDFEAGFGNWTDGGTDCILYTASARAHQGSNAANLQDNTNTSVMDTSNLLLSGHSEITVEFWCYPNSMENSEDFWLQISTDGGSSYTTVKAWVNNVDFTNGTFFQDTVTISGYSLTDQTRLRFRCDASGNGDDIYLDEIDVTVK